MNIFQIAIFVLCGLMVVMILIALIVLAVRNVRGGLRLQGQLERQVQGLRLSRMLARRGIDIQRYLRRMTTTSLLEHTDNCRNCPNTEACDEHLQTTARQQDNYPYCPNAKALKAIVEQQRR